VPVVACRGARRAIQDPPIRLRAVGISHNRFPSVTN
jgi:hypothetical protein